MFGYWPKRFADAIRVHKDKSKELEQHPVTWKSLVNKGFIT